MSSGAAWIEHNVPATWPAGEVVACWVTVENRGAVTWQPGAVKIAVALDGAPLAQLDLPHPVEPGERASLHWVFRTPGSIAEHTLAFDVAEGGDPPNVSFWTSDVSFWTLHVSFWTFEQPLTPTRRLRDRVLDTHARTWLPCDGVSWSRNSPGYPQLARKAAGCWLTDVEGRRYADFLMGWGTALLGYANARIQRAVADALYSGATLTLTHELMPEVADQLCAMFPGAEAATFGKNGSDVCTAAVRMARVHTGKQVVLSCGYHGWHDWWVERYGFAATGVPLRGEPLLFSFPPNDLEAVQRLFETHRGNVAAVMLEPAGVIEGVAGPIRDADAAFLKELAALTRAEGALLIFDEIMTGFRYRGGSVQHAVAVTPDLTCLGKALSGGMPLSAVIGRRDVFHSAIGRIYYEPTFKGETYSFAAAREALAIIREEDVPARIQATSDRLRTILGELCASYKIPAEVIGPPFRMMLAFPGVEERKRRLMRTLVQQEILRRGVLTTQNLLLPSIAHDEEALDVARRAFDGAFRVLASAIKEDRFVPDLEIPPLPG